MKCERDLEMPWGTCRILHNTGSHFPPIILCWLPAIWSYKKRYSTAHTETIQCFSCFHSVLFCCCHCEDGVPHFPHPTLWEDAILLLNCRWEMAEAWGELISKPLYKESIKKGRWWNCLPVYPRHPPLALLWWRNLCQCHLKNQSLLAVLTC